MSIVFDRPADKHIQLKILVVVVVVVVVVMVVVGVVKRIFCVAG